MNNFRKNVTTLLVFVLPLLVGAREVRFDTAATHFTESTPFGNGRLGAMVFGDPWQETIILNENGMWSGSAQDSDREDAYQALPEIQRLLKAGEYVEAEALVNANFTCKGEGSGRGHGANTPYGCYQTLGKLHLRFLYEDGMNVESYERVLDLENAIGTIRYRMGETEFSREFFVSKPDEVFALRLSSSTPQSINFDVWIDRQERFKIEVLDGDKICMSGQLNDGYDGKNGVKYTSLLSVQTKEGKVTQSGEVLKIRDASEVILLLTAATDIETFAGRNISDSFEQASDELQLVQAKDFEVIKRHHIQDYQHYFSRVNFNLGSPKLAEIANAKPIVERLGDLAQGKEDQDLYALYFDFGRYLLISSSRPGGLPANLQGIWAEAIQTPWNGDWHTNINVQMNYWPAEVCNLSELHQPMFSLIESLVEPGRKTAQAYYGADGWVGFLLANPWGYTSPGESASWGSTVSCSAWMCQHLWDHYLYTEDREFLKWAYPILKSSAEFYEDILVPYDDGNWLVTSPSNSPENAFITESGETAHVCMGPTIDQQLLRYLFQACIDASVILGIDEPFRQSLVHKRSKLVPTRLGPDGRIMEWLQPFEEADPHHRHVAHLWGLFPGHEISPVTTPELADGARKSLDVRGDEGTGWSLGFKLAMWARLRDGNRAEKVLIQHLKPANQETSKQRWSGGTYPNLFDSHPPFQIDGNLGGTAAIAEMLIQCSPDEIYLLPALPDSWSDGSICGLKARGGYEVDIEWSGGMLTHVRIISESQQHCRVIYGDRVFEIELQANKSHEIRL